MIKALWPVWNSFHMLNNGTVSSPAHIISVFEVSQHIFKLAGTTVDAVMHTLPPCFGRVMGNGGTRVFQKQTAARYIYIQGVTGGTDQTSGGCSLC